MIFDPSWNKNTLHVISNIADFLFEAGNACFILKTAKLEDGGT